MRAALVPLADIPEWDPPQVWAESVRLASNGLDILLSGRNCGGFLPRG